MPDPANPCQNSPLAVAVAGGSSIAAAARLLGIPERTAYRESASAEFKAAVGAIRREATEQALGSLADAAVAAVATLRAELVARDDGSSASRISAARAILSHLLDVGRHIDIDARIAAVEARLGGTADDPRS